MTPKTAVVILNWNGRKMLEQFLPSVIANTSNNNSCIYVADNGSSDDSIEYLSTNFPEIKQIKLDKNYGFAGGYNRALQNIDADYFMLLNSDVEVSENWLEPLVDYLDANSDVAACMPKILAYANKASFEYAGAAGGFIDKYGYPFCRGRILSYLEKDEEQYNSVIDVFWTTGACMLVRAKIFNELGGFDADFFAHMEEIDLCWRIKQMGHRLVCVPQAKIYHLGGGTLNANSPRKLYLNFRNNLFLLHKNLPKAKFKRSIIKRMILDGMSAMVYLFTLKFSAFMAVVKAHMHYYKAIKSLNKKRKEILKVQKVSQFAETYQKSIVFSFFKSKKKLKFSDLKF